MLVLHSLHSQDVTGRRQPSADRTLHAGGALDMASADEACLRMRLLRPARLLVPLPALQDHHHSVSGKSSLSQEQTQTISATERCHKCMTACKAVGLISRCL